MSIENIDPTCEDIELAKLVLSDCGCSTEHAALLDRLAARIAKHAEKVAAYEREACAKVCETAGNEWADRSPRKQHHTGAGIGALKCADLIRARGQQ